MKHNFILLFVLVLYSLFNPVMSQTTVTFQINSGSDDVEEEGPTGVNLGPGGMYSSSSDLELTQDFDSPSSGVQTIGLRFNGINIPQGAIVTSASIEFVADSPDSPNTNNGATSLTIRGDDSDNAAAFTTTDYDVSNRTTTTASAAWSPSAWTVGVAYSSSDISSVVQEILDRPGWSSSNSMVFIITGTGSRTATSYNGSSSDAPILSVTYYLNNNFITGKVFNDLNGNAVYDGVDTGESGVTVKLYDDNNQDGLVDGGDTQIQTEITDGSGDYAFGLANTYSSSYDGSVSLGTDDGRNNNLTEDKLIMGKNIWIGTRFQNITIPSGATVTSAYLEFESKKNKSANTSRVKIYAHDIANPPTFVSSASGISGLTRTTANVTWTISSWSTDVTYQSPDITTVINELLTSYGAYSSGNMAFIMEPTGTQEREAYSYEHASGDPPRLVINYTLASSNYYVLEVDVSTLPVGYSFTTDNVETAVFTAAGQTDSGNNFGFNLNVCGKVIMNPHVRFRVTN